jgi:hypothetical protein
MVRWRRRRRSRARIVGVKRDIARRGNLGLLQVIRHSVLTRRILSAAGSSALCCSRGLVAAPGIKSRCTLTLALSSVCTHLTKKWRSGSNPQNATRGYRLTSRPRSCRSRQGGRQNCFPFPAKVQPVGMMDSIHYRENNQGRLPAEAMACQVEHGSQSRAQHVIGE